MNIAELFIRRPVMTTLVTAGITIFGIMAYRSLPVSDLPNIDFPTINVNANLPGASPEVMASSDCTDGPGVGSSITAWSRRAIGLGGM